MRPTTDEIESDLRLLVDGEVLNPERPRAWDADVVSACLNNRYLEVLRLLRCRPPDVLPAAVAWLRAAAYRALGEPHVADLFHEFAAVQAKQVEYGPVPDALRQAA